MDKHYKIVVSGKVQGVFYRASAKAKAEAIGVCGKVENKPDGSVYIEAEGDTETLKEFLAWCWRGPMSAKVVQVHFEEGDLVPFTTFRIVRR